MKPTLLAILDDAFLSQPPTRVYYSEAALQLKLGIELWRRLGVEPELEIRHPRTGQYLDVLLTVGGVRWGIELKYKTRAHPSFNYTQQGAQDHGRYDFINDISRIEEFVASGFIDGGFACLVTNDPLYWGTLRTASFAKAFQLTDGTILSGSYIPTWKHRTQTINLRGQYLVQWQDASNPVPANAPFRALLVEHDPISGNTTVPVENGCAVPLSFGSMTGIQQRLPTSFSPATRFQ